MQHILAKRARAEFLRVNFFFVSNIKSNVQHQQRSSQKCEGGELCVCLPMMLTITAILFGKESVRKIVRSNVANSYLNSIYPSWHHITFRHTYREHTHTHKHRPRNVMCVFFLFRASFAIRNAGGFKCNQPTHAHPYRMSGIEAASGLYTHAMPTAQWKLL